MRQICAKSTSQNETTLLAQLSQPANTLKRPFARRSRQTLYSSRSIPARCKLAVKRAELQVPTELSHRANSSHC